MYDRRFGSLSRGVPLWQLLGGAIAVLVLFGGVFRTIHLATVRHVSCPFDGALVHADDLPRYVQEELAAQKRHAVPVSAIPPHHHDDCGSLAVSLRHFVGASKPAAVRQARDVRGALVLGVGESGFERSVLSYAPRLPPPA